MAADAARRQGLNRARQRVLICGGGAGGLEVAVRLARQDNWHVTLADRQATHLWKPLLHEVASGGIDAHAHEVSYLALARWHGFEFMQGALAGLDRANRRITLEAVRDERGEVVIPQREVAYDWLVIAIGGISNDFGIPGVERFALRLDTQQDAEAIRSQLVRACMAANYGGQSPPPRFEVAIVGGGATGVELAGELRAAARLIVSYGLDRLDPDRFLALTVVNADARLLLQLPESISEGVAQSLKGLGIAVRNGEMVVEVAADLLVLKGGERLRADLIVWAAGVKGPAVLRSLDGLETNRQGQLVVGADLRVSGEERVFAIGDCAACPWLDHGGTVPARAQASHQQAAHLARNLARAARGYPLAPFRYVDFGSLVSLGTHGGVIGTLMGVVTGRSYRLQGLLARWFYVWLYKQHRAKLFGWWAVLLEGLGNWVGGATRPQIKLH